MYIPFAFITSLICFSFHANGSDSDFRTLKKKTIKGILCQLQVKHLK